MSLPPPIPGTHENLDDRPAPVALAPDIWSDANPESDRDVQEWSIAWDWSLEHPEREAYAVLARQRWAAILANPENCP